MKTKEKKNVLYLCIDAKINNSKPRMEEGSVKYTIQIQEQYTVPERVSTGTQFPFKHRYIYKNNFKISRYL